MGESLRMLDANTTRRPNLNPHDERRVAVLAGCDPRTVRAFLRGATQRSTVVARINEALVTLGFLDPAGAA